MTQTVFRRSLGPTKLKDYCKIYRNQGKFDVKCVEFTTAWCLTGCEGIVPQNSIAVATALQIFTEHMYRISGFSFI